MQKQFLLKKVKVHLISFVHKGILVSLHTGKNVQTCSPYSIKSVIRKNGYSIQVGSIFEDFMKAIFKRIMVGLLGYVCRKMIPFEND